MINITYKCSKCGKTKEEDNFYHNWVWRKNKTIKILYRNPVCIECVKNETIIRNKENPEKRKLQIKKDNARHKKIEAHRANGKRQREIGYTSSWQKSNPDKIRQYAQNHRTHDISTKEYNSMCKAFNYSCAYCGRSLEEVIKETGQKLHKEHVDNEGYNDLRNCVPACRSCNDHKWKFGLNEWYNESNTNFTTERYNKIIWWTTEGYKDYIEEKPPYRITKSREYDEDGSYTYKWELWGVDDKRNLVECVDIKSKKKDLLCNYSVCKIK